ncbi:MAG: tetratricopeptide repeat protein [Nitrospira sp.]|nr:tetratricopeptide repeat protein [Nitrospira sp.]MCP9442594.1 tetratricopeptide repeat protein [Nitrospira sp.]
MPLDRGKVLQQAQLLASRGQYEHAVGEWKKLAAEAPHDGSIHNSIGDLHLKHNAIADAVASFLKAAEAFREEGATLKAIAAYKKVLKCDPTKYEVHQHLGDLNAERGLVSSAVQDYLTAAKHFLKARKPKEALALYRKIVKLDPSNLNAQQCIAELCLQDNQQEEATRVYLQLARERSAQGRHGEAKEAYQAVLNIDPQNSEAAQYLESFKGGKFGLITLQQSKDTEVLLRPSDPLGQLAEVVRRMDEGQYDGAEAILNQMLSRDPGNPQVCQLLARLHLQRGDLQVALGEYRFLAGAALRAQDFRLAESLITEFLSQQPDSVPLLELYGELYEEQHDPASAALQYAKAIELLLAHPEPGMEGYHEELFEKVRSLSPDTELVERLAAKIQGEAVPTQNSVAAQGESAIGHGEVRLLGEKPEKNEKSSVSEEKPDGLQSESVPASSVPVQVASSGGESRGAGVNGACPAEETRRSRSDLFAKNESERTDFTTNTVLTAPRGLCDRTEHPTPAASPLPSPSSVPDYEAHFLLGIAYKNMGLYPEAREEFTVSRQATKYYLDACLMTALCFKEEGRLAEAIRELETLLADSRCRGTKAQAIRYELALLYEADAQWEKATTTFEAIASFHDVPERLAALKRRITSAGENHLPAA